MWQMWLWKKLWPQLSKWCYDLEILGNNENIEELQKRTPEMLELYRSYKDVLKPYAVWQNEEKEEVSKEKIVESLREIVTAIDTFDLDLADEIMKQLEGYRLEETIEPYMDELRAYVADVAMEEIMATAKKMMEMIEG